MSDVDIVISSVEDAAPTDSEAHEAQNSTSTVLQQFPGHSPILSLSPYFKAQASDVFLLLHTISPFKSAFVRCWCCWGTPSICCPDQNSRANLLIS